MHKMGLYNTLVADGVFASMDTIFFSEPFDTDNRSATASGKSS